MTDDRTTPALPSDLAAEFALGVLTGEDLRRARELARNDPRFRAEVGRWRGRLAPLLEDVQSVEPPIDVWDRLDLQTHGRNGRNNVIELRRGLRRWRGLAAGMTALAAGLAVFIVTRPSPQPVQIERPAGLPLVAMLGEPKKPTQVVASWDPAAQQLVLAVAGELPSDPRHAHELWVIPAGGTPRSLGTLASARQTHKRVTDALAKLLQQGATMAISVEPPGGSPTGAPTGPVIASGKLVQA